LSAPVSGSLVDLFRRHAQERPDLVLYRFLGNGENESDRLGCAQLDRRARAIAASLQLTAEPGDRALLLYPPGLEFIAAFMGCLYAGVVAVPAYPPNPNQSLSRLQAIAADAGARLMLTTRAQLSALTRGLARSPGLTVARTVATDGIAESSCGDWREPELDGKTVAFLQYTSGSTRAPRGVVVSHANLLHNEHMIQQAFHHDRETRVVGWLPPYHDMGLIGNVLQPLTLGIPCILMSPLAFLQHPVRWLRAISEFRATTSGAPNFAYDLCVRKITEEQCRGLDLSSWDLAYNGAEAVRASTLESFSKKFAPHGFRREAFYPCYGLAEATLFVTGGTKGTPPVIRDAPQAANEPDSALALWESALAVPRVVGCGHAWDDTRVVIVDPHTRVPCPAGVVGELWISGRSVARGYWNRPEESESTFQARLSATDEGPFLRTGDLGFADGGDVFITGRLKELIIVRGRNYHPEDIELTVENSHPALRAHSGAAFSVTTEDKERLVVVQELERKALRKVDLDKVQEDIVEAVAMEHGLSVHEAVLVAPGSVPRTSSGKIQRGATRVAYLSGNLECLTDAALLRATR
jgi:acyl-CoA synthetase (AMP-forming)/AMP-acid ligase II